MNQFCAKNFGGKKMKRFLCFLFVGIILLQTAYAEINPSFKTDSFYLMLPGKWDEITDVFYFPDTFLEPDTDNMTYAVYARNFIGRLDGANYADGLVFLLQLDLPFLQQKFPNEYSENIKDYELYIRERMNFLDELGEPFQFVTKTDLNIGNSKKDAIFAEMKTSEGINALLYATFFTGQKSLLVIGYLDLYSFTGHTVSNVQNEFLKILENLIIR